MSATKRVYLTPQEQQSAAIAAQEAVDKGKRHHGIVDAVLDAINAHREDAK